jgi:ABC-type maltose transport system permease subunit
MSNRFSIAEPLILILGIVLLASFYLLPWATVDGATYTGLEIMQSAVNSSRVLPSSALPAMMFMPLAGVLGIVFGGLAIFLRSLRSVTSGVGTFAGVITLFYYLLVLGNAGYLPGGFDLGLLGIGFWLGLIAAIGLTAQIAIPRPRLPINVVEQKWVYGTLQVIVLGLAIIFALFPIIFVTSSAINPTGQLSTQGFIPSAVDEPGDLIVNFRAILYEDLDISPYWNWLFNSIFVASTSTIAIVLITALSAYSFSRFRFSGRRTLLVGILLIQVFPNLLAMVAIFLILQQISQLPDLIPVALPFLSGIDWGWLRLFGLDSLGGLILVYMGGAMGINTWLMKGFFDSIPRDIDESAKVDGATDWQIFWRLIFPLVRPILAVVGVLAFVGTFNEFVLARVLLRDKDNWTLMIGLFNFVNGDLNQDWGKFAAGSLVAAVPVVIVYLSLQDQIVGGLTAGSVKG